MKPALEVDFIAIFEGPESLVQIHDFQFVQFLLFM